MASPLAAEHALVWGSLNAATGSKEDDAWRLCRQYIDRRVSGVFFAPLELAAAKDDVNARIARALDDAGIPVVLLDRTVVPYPRRGHHDLVGIDNRRAGYVITEHLLHARRAAARVRRAAQCRGDRRRARRGLSAKRSMPPGRRSNRRWCSASIPEDAAAVRQLMTPQPPDGIVCANDRTAARLMRTLLGLGYRIPADVRLVGIDDADFAELLPVPLTTLRQPSRQIGDAALATMLQRVARRDLPTRDILLHCELIVRESSGRVDCLLTSARELRPRPGGLGTGLADVVAQVRNWSQRTASAVRLTGVRLRRRRTLDGGDHRVPRLLERQAQRRGELAKDRPGLVVQEHAAGRQHRGDVRRRQRQLRVVEIRQDVRGDHQIEAAAGQPLGDDVERLGAEGRGGRRADADGLVEMSAVVLTARGRPQPAGRQIAAPSLAK